MLVDTGAQVSPVRKGLLSSRSVRRSTAPVTLRVANGELLEGGRDRAAIRSQLSHLDLGHKHQIKGVLYKADMLKWDMIREFAFLDIAQAGVLPHTRTLLVEEANKLSWLCTSMEPQASPWEPATRDVIPQAVTSASTTSPTADIEDEYGLSEAAFHMALGEIGLSTHQVDVLGSAALWKCHRVRTNQDNGRKRVWSSELWNLLYMHAQEGSLQCVMSKIARDRAWAVMTIPS